MAGAPKQEDLLSQLFDADPVERRQAASGLLSLAGQNLPAGTIYGAIPALEQALTDSDDETRRTSALALLARAWKFKPLRPTLDFLQRGLVLDEQNAPI